MNPFSMPSFLKFTPSRRAEEDKKRWVQELDRQLPGYKQARREVGRVLKELKDIYRGPAYRGSWQKFLRSRDLAVSTANELVRKYLQGDSAQRKDPKDPKEPSPFVTLRLPIPTGQREQFKNAIHQLGRERAAELIFATLTQAAGEETGSSSAKTAEPKPTPTRKPAAAPKPESAASGRFKQRAATSPRRSERSSSQQNQSSSPSHPKESPGIQGSNAEGSPDLARQVEFAEFDRFEADGEPLPAPSPMLPEQPREEQQARADPPPPPSPGVVTNGVVTRHWETPWTEPYGLYQTRCR